VLQGYWYSRYNLGSLVMKSGNGVTFMPPDGMPQEMAAMVSDDESTATPPQNPALLSRVYDGGDPTFINADDGNPMNLANGRWPAATVTTTSPSSAAWTIIKEVEWAKLFHVDGHFGVTGGEVDGIPGAQQRFIGIPLYVSAINQAMEWMNNRAAFSSGDTEGEYLMMLALSGLADVTLASAMPHSTTNRYAMVGGMIADMNDMGDAAALGGMLLQAAGMIFANAPAPATISERAAAITGLVWFAAADEANKAAALAKIASYATELVGEAPNGVVEHAHRVRGLLEASRILGDAAYLTAATESYQQIEDGYDWKKGVFAGQDSYTVDDIGVILGALNSTIAHGDSSLTNVTKLTTSFFESFVNLSGLQLSAPPVAALPAYEQLPNEMFHRYPSVPKPPMAGGDHGTAPVFAASVTYDRDAGTWTQERSFNTAGAMHLANEMIWMHGDEVSGYPIVD